MLIDGASRLLRRSLNLGTQRRHEANVYRIQGRGSTSGLARTPTQPRDVH